MTIKRRPEWVVPQVEGVKAVPGVAQGLGLVAPLDGRCVVGNKGVQPGHLMAVGQQAFAQERADEPCRSGDHALHDRCLVGCEPRNGRPEAPSKHRRTLKRDTLS